MLDRLFSPLAIGSVTIPNRIVSTSHQTSLVHHHLPTDELIAYHRARARGGAGLIVVEATAIHHTGLLTAHTLGGYLPRSCPHTGACPRPFTSTTRACSCSSSTAGAR